MKTRPLDVASYVAAVAADHRAGIEALRKLCRKHLKGYEECFEYGMPCYKRNGVLEVSFASRKQYISLHVLKSEVVEKYRAAFPMSSIGKGCIRFKKPEHIDFEAIGRLLRSNVSSKASPC